MFVEDFGITNDKFYTALANPDTGLIEVDPITNTATEVTFLNPLNGFTTVFRGPNLSFDPGSGASSGTVTGLDIFDGANPVQLISNISWGFAETISAIIDFVENDDPDALLALLDRQDITYDGTNSDIGTDLNFEPLSVDVTWIGSDFDDYFESGSGNDTILGGDGADDLRGNDGDDVIDASGGSASTQAFGDFIMPGLGQNTIIGHQELFETRSEGIDLSYENVSGVGGITFDIGAEGSGIAVSGDTRVNDTFTFANFFVGSGDSDLFNGSDEDRFEGFVGGGGADTILGNGGFDELNYSFENDILGTFGGIFVNMVAGTVIDTAANTDVFSGIEQIRGTQSSDLFEARTTSDGMVFYGEGGNDTIFGSSGFDAFDGGNGNDEINIGTGASVRKTVFGSNGTDIVDVSDMPIGGASDVTFTFGRLDPAAGGIFVDINMLTDLAQVAHANGLTRIVGFNDLVSTTQSDNFTVIDGTSANDSFEVLMEADTFLSLSGGAGSDTFFLTTAGQLRLNYLGGSEGLVANLATGVVSNDGTGAADSLTLTIETGGSLQLMGTDFADNVIGSDADERFRLFDGNDTVDGGAGVDEIDYNRSSISQLVVDLGAGTATGLWDGSAFADTLSGIEDIRGGRSESLLIGSAGANYLQSGWDTPGDTMAGGAGEDTLRGREGDDLLLGDAYDAAIDAQVGTVYRLYKATLDRDPDQGGLLDWAGRLDTGTSLVDIAAGFVGSPEFERDYGGLDNTAFVTLLYQNVLGRDPDAGGLADWVGQLDGGTSRAQVVTGFSESTEFKNNTFLDSLDFFSAGRQVDWGDEVYRLYRATLDRDPDTGGFADWSGRLAEGTPLLDAITGFVASREFANTYGNTSDEEFVELLYQNVLNRASDAAGLADWLGRMASGTSREEVVAGFSESREFINNTATDYAVWSGNQRDDQIEAQGGTNTVYGGILSDVFVFNAATPSTTTVADFESWDVLAFDDFTYASRADVIAQMSQSGDNVTLADQGQTITLIDTLLSDITESQIELW